MATLIKEHINMNEEMKKINKIASEAAVVFCIRCREEELTIQATIAASLCMYKKLAESILSVTCKRLPRHQRAQFKNEYVGSFLVIAEALKIINAEE